mgnify:CR=1 FL=1|jgi:hypothetical protein
MRKRGWDFFVMFLARELKMTRRRLLSELDSHEICLWQAYFKESQKPPEEKQDPATLRHNLETAFLNRNQKVKKGKKK